MDRRSFLATFTAVLAVGAAGCSESEPRTTEPGASPTPTADTTPTPTAEQETPTPPDESDTTPTVSAEPTATPSPRPEADATVAVGPDGTLRFSPSTLTISAGETIRWVWESGGHNVKADSVPSGATWSGTPGGAFDTFDSGHTYSHTFDVAGTYDYYCAPHRSSGMTATFTVE